MDWHEAAVRDLNPAELEFTLGRAEKRRAEAARILTRVALRNRAAVLGGLVACGAIGAAPLALLPVLPAWVVGGLTTACLLVLVRVLSRHRRLNALIATRRAEEYQLREQLVELGGTVQAIHARLKH